MFSATVGCEDSTTSSSSSPIHLPKDVAHSSPSLATSQNSFCETGQSCSPVRVKDELSEEPCDQSSDEDSVLELFSRSPSPQNQSPAPSQNPSLSPSQNPSLSFSQNPSFSTSQNHTRSLSKNRSCFPYQSQSLSPSLNKSDSDTNSSSELCSMPGLTGDRFSMSLDSNKRDKMKRISSSLVNELPYKTSISEGHSSIPLTSRLSTHAVDRPPVCGSPHIRDPSRFGDTSRFGDPSRVGEPSHLAESTQRIHGSCVMEPTRVLQENALEVLSQAAAFYTKNSFVRPTTLQKDMLDIIHGRRSIRQSRNASKANQKEAALRHGPWHPFYQHQGPRHSLPYDPSKRKTHFSGLGLSPRGSGQRALSPHTVGQDAQAGSHPTQHYPLDLSKTDNSNTNTAGLPPVLGLPPVSHDTAASSLGLPPVSHDTAASVKDHRHRQPRDKRTTSRNVPGVSAVSVDDHFSRSLGNNWHSMIEKEANMAAHSMTEKEANMAVHSMIEKDANMAVHSVIEKKANMSVHSMTEKEANMAVHSMTEKEANMAVHSMTEKEANMAVHSMIEKEANMAVHSVIEKEANMVVHSMTEKEATVAVHIKQEPEAEDTNSSSSVTFDPDSDMITLGPNKGSSDESLSSAVDDHFSKALGEGWKDLQATNILS